MKDLNILIVEGNLREENKKQGLKSNSVQLIKLPLEWEPYKFDLSPQQRQFCQLTNRFFKDMDKAVASKNEIRINDAIDHIQPGNFDFSIHNDKSQALKTTYKGFPISLG